MKQSKHTKEHAQRVSKLTSRMAASANFLSDANNWIKNAKNTIKAQETLVKSFGPIRNADDALINQYIQTVSEIIKLEQTAGAKRAGAAGKAGGKSRGAAAGQAAGKAKDDPEKQHKQLVKRADKLYAAITKGYSKLLDSQKQSIADKSKIEPLKN